MTRRRPIDLRHQEVTSSPSAAPRRHRGASGRAGILSAFTLSLVGCAHPLPSLEGSTGESGESGESGNSTIHHGDTTTDETTSSDESTSDAESEPCPRNDGPYAIRADQLLDVPASEGPLVNDGNCSDMLVVSAYDHASALGGQVTAQEDGSFSYQPFSSQPYGTDTFEYMVEDGYGRTANAQVRVAVQPANASVKLDELAHQGVRMQGTTPGDLLGETLAGAGDVNGDGYADLLLGAFRASPGGAASAGESYLVLGRLQFPPLLQMLDADSEFTGIDANDNSGTSLASAGDINGDGFSDLLIGAHRANVLTGEVYLVYGRPVFPDFLHLDDADVRLAGNESGDEIGVAASGVGDVNGDGYTDIFVSGSSSDDTCPEGGYLFLGRSNLARTLNLQDADARFCGNGNDFVRVASGAGDVNGDGLADILLGGGGGTWMGSARLFLGSAGFPSNVDMNDPDVYFTGQYIQGVAGAAVSGAGDLNGDGYDDILIGDLAASPEGVYHAGESYVIFGSPSLPSFMDPTDADIRIIGVDTNTQSGWSVSNARDFNSDGFADLVVSAPTAPGECYLILGRFDLPPVLDLVDADVRFYGTDDTLVGLATNGVGDANGDGYDDFIVGAPVGNDAAGEAYLVFGDDVSAKTTILGTPFDDTLASDRGVVSDIIVGGGGDDILFGDGGADVLRGGTGNDTLIVSDDTFFRIDGGLGIDTLALTADLSLSQSALTAARITSIEHIQLSLDGPSSVVISPRSLVNLSESSNTLVVDGDADDEVVLLEPTWTGPVPDGSYLVYTFPGSAGVLRIDAIVSVATERRR